jgi:hypothetical protein
MTNLPEVHHCGVVADPPSTFRLVQCNFKFPNDELSVAEHRVGVEAMPVEIRRSLAINSVPELGFVGHDRLLSQITY